jgi:hypothetical protein
VNGNYPTLERSPILHLTCPTFPGYRDVSLRPGVQPVNCVCWVMIAVAYQSEVSVLQRLAAMDLDPRQLPPDRSSGFIAAITNPCEKTPSRASADNAHQRPGLRSRCCGRSARFRPTPGQAVISNLLTRRKCCAYHDNLSRGRSFWQMPTRMKLGAISQQSESMCEGV